QRRAGPTPAAQPGDPARLGDGLPEMPGEGPTPTLWLGSGTGRRPREVSVGGADRGPPGREGRARRGMGKTSTGDRRIARARRSRDITRGRWSVLAMAPGGPADDPDTAKERAGRATFV